jgi:hypothetical protein
MSGVSACGVVPGVPLSTPEGSTGCAHTTSNTIHNKLSKPNTTQIQETVIWTSWHAVCAWPQHQQPKKAMSSRPGCLQAQKLRYNHEIPLRTLQPSDTKDQSQPKNKIALLLSTRQKDLQKPSG